MAFGYAQDQGGGMNHNNIAKEKSHQVIEAELSPRRKLHALRFLNYVAAHGLKVLVDGRAFTTIESEINLDKGEANQAIDDAYAAGLVAVSMCGDDAQMVTLTPFADRVGGLSSRRAL